MKYISNKVLVVALLGLFSIPAFSEASHRSTSRYSVDTSSLDTKVVETFPIPVLFGVESDNLIPDFGDPRGGGTREHEGQDMRAPQGTPIVIPTEAVVLRTGTGASAGKYVYTANPGGEVFRYMHLDYIADIRVGDELSPGDFIGTVGDTGNAGEGIYHLHFEVRDKNNNPTDPYERFGQDFSLKQKISFLDDILQDVEDDETFAEFLVTEFETDFSEALTKKYSLPDAIELALEDSDLTLRLKLLEQLDTLIDSIPALLSKDLQVGDSGGEVSLLQTYLLFRSQGSARDQLAGAGATGYYGSITAAAVSEWQINNDMVVSGRWDGGSRTELAK